MNILFSQGFRGIVCWLDAMILLSHTISLIKHGYRDARKDGDVGVD